MLTALWSSAARKGASKVLHSHSLSYLYTKDMLWSFKTYLWGIRVFLGIKETGCSNKFSAYLTPSRSTELSQQQLLPVVFKVREIPTCWSLTWHTPESFLPAEEEIFLRAKQATTVSLTIPVHFRRTCSLDHNSHIILNLPFSWVNYATD